VSTGVGLIVLAVIFAAGVVLFGLLAITLLPGTVFLEDRLQAIRARRGSASQDANEPAE
jgi:hypothetical protein